MMQVFLNDIGMFETTVSKNHPRYKVSPCAMSARRGSNCPTVYTFNDLFREKKDLLTFKQRKYFENYYFEDLTLSEIAENFRVSRQAIQTALHKSSENLRRFEEALRIHEKRSYRCRVLKELEEAVRKSPYYSQIAGLTEKIKGL